MGMKDFLKTKAGKIVLVAVLGAAIAVANFLGFAPVADLLQPLLPQAEAVSE